MSNCTILFQWIIGLIDNSYLSRITNYFCVVKYALSKKRCILHHLLNFLFTPTFSHEISFLPSSFPLSVSSPPLPKPPPSQPLIPIATRQVSSLRQTPRFLDFYFKRWLEVGPTEEIATESQQWQAFGWWLVRCWHDRRTQGNRRLEMEVGCGWCYVVVVHV